MGSLEAIILWYNGWTRDYNKNNTRYRYRGDDARALLYYESAIASYVCLYHCFHPRALEILDDHEKSLCSAVNEKFPSVVSTVRAYSLLAQDCRATCAPRSKGRSLLLERIEEYETPHSAANEDHLLIDSGLWETPFSLLAQGYVTACASR